MTTPDITAQLAADLHTLHRAGKIASPWLEGMRLVVLRALLTGEPVDPLMPPDPGRYIGRGMGGLAVCRNAHYGRDDRPWLAPDLSDPLTAAGLIVLVREASGDPGAHVAASRSCGWWWVYRSGGTGPIGSGPTEAAALCAALHGLAVPR